MFRLIKTLGNSSINENVVELGIKVNGAPISGSAVSCTNNIISNTNSDAAPDYIFKSSSASKSTVFCYSVTNDMIFKVEYTSAMTPKIGMKVGIADKNGASDAVAYNSNGKGIIVDVINKNMVHVRFQKS